MMKTKNNQLNRGLVRRLIIGAGKDNKISRQELIRLTRLNPRTVDSYTAEMEEFGIIEHCSVTNGQGRPEKYYIIKNESFLFLGICQWKNKFYFMLSDLDINPFHTVRLELDLTGNVADEVDRTEKIISDAICSFPQFRLLGIGMIFHPFLAKPQEKMFFPQLVKKLGSRYQVPLKQVSACGGMLSSVYHQESMLHYEYTGKEPNLALINPADKIHLGLLLDGLVQDLTRRTSRCDKQLLDGIIRHDEIPALFPAESGIKSVFDYRQAIYMKNKDALKVSQLEAERLAVSIKRLKKYYHLDKLFLISLTPNTINNLLKLAAADPELKDFPIASLREFSMADYLQSGCNLAIQITYGNFLYSFLTN